MIFDETSYLGIDGVDAKIGDVITFDSGENEIIIYNGAESGPLTFLISFSGAVATTVTASVAALSALFAF